MKNLILALSLVFALGANAQTKKTVPVKAPKTVVAAPKVKISDEDAAKKNLADLNSFTTLTPEKQAVFLELFNTKFRMLHKNGELTPERKTYVSQVISRKIEGSLDAQTFEKVKANTTLYQSLIN